VSSVAACITQREHTFESKQLPDPPIQLHIPADTGVSVHAAAGDGNVAQFAISIDTIPIVEIRSDP
jgi:hypothetical protein